MAVGSNGSQGQAEHGLSRFTRLTAASYPGRPAEQKIPPFDLRGTIEVISKSRKPNSGWGLAERETRPSIGKDRQNGADRTIRIAPLFVAGMSGARMPIHQLLTWTQVEGRLELRRKIPRGMAVDLVLDGGKGEWRLVRGSRPRDEVVRGVYSAQGADQTLSSLSSNA